MPRSTVDWSTTEVWQRLLAAVIASGVKIDIAVTANYLGISYDALESRLRTVKAEAKAMKEKVNTDGPMTPNKKKESASAKKSSPQKNVLSGVKSGRVAKSPSKTPSKSANKKGKSTQKPTSSADSSNEDADATERNSLVKEQDDGYEDDLV